MNLGPGELLEAFAIDAFDWDRPDARFAALLRTPVDYAMAPGIDRRPSPWVAGTKEDDTRGSSRGSDVRYTGVVGHEEVETIDDGRQCPDVGLTGEVHYWPIELRLQLSGQRPLLNAASQDQRSAGLTRKEVAQLGKSIDWPTARGKLAAAVKTNAGSRNRQ
jgi:hypothetical protein